MRSSKNAFLSTLSYHLDRHTYYLQKNIELVRSIKAIIASYPSLAKPIGLFLKGEMSAESLLKCMMNAGEESRHSMKEALLFFTAHIDCNGREALKTLKYFIDDAIIEAE